MTGTIECSTSDSDDGGTSHTSNYVDSIVHICFLQHGLNSLAKDLGYMKHAIEGRSSELQSHRNATRSDLQEELVVHGVTCNEGKTKDGVCAGGERLLEEMLQVIRAEVERKRDERRSRKERYHQQDWAHVDKDDDTIDSNEDKEPPIDVTISMVGNSLGGIYSRYAIAHLHRKLESRDDDDANEDGYAGTLDNGRIRVYFQTFCTTATPHLGCSRHTWISLPRSAEIAVGYILGDTGRDLFRITDILHKMALDEFYLTALRKFRKRVAYANGYHTDFPVPASTAAFLHEDSSHEHFWEKGTSQGDKELEKYIVAVLHTQPTSSETNQRDLDCEDELKAMSLALDSLGWKKVIVDLRQEMPIGLSVPNLLRKRLSTKIPSPSALPLSLQRQDELLQQMIEPDDSENCINDYEDFDDHLRQSPLVDSVAHRNVLRRKSSISSKDAMAAFASPRDGSVHLPLGHNMICAFSRSRVSSHMNRGGRPIMDNLAKELVDDIFVETSSPNLLLTNN